jgi:hypothetical protein
MPISRRIVLAFCLAGLSFASLVSVSLAGEPAAVTVRVQGVNGETLLPQTSVTTNTNSIPVESGSCPGTSAGGALYDATHGNWTVKYGGEGVEIDGIEGLTFPSLAENPGVYWAFWLNGEYATLGACDEEVTNGARIVFVAQCYELGAYCPGSPTAPDHFLTMTAPTESTVNVGEPVSVTIASRSTETGQPELSLPPDVAVSVGSTSVSPGAGGVATLSFPGAGTYTLQAHAPDSVFSDVYTICVHNGNDGNCGTTTAGGTSTSGSGADVTTSTTAPYKGPYALVAKATGLVDGHVYPRGSSPRVLSGSVSAHTAISSVSLELRREYKGRCYAYEGVRERFIARRCGAGSLFKVSTKGSFSYLLPAALPPGRYVLDIKANDVAGNTTTLARGTSRIVFYVR